VFYLINNQLIKHTDYDLEVFEFWLMKLLSE